MTRARNTRVAMVEVAESNEIKVGDTIDLGKPAGFVRLPDGVVVTARRFYKVEHEGVHVAEGIEYNATAPAKDAEPIEDAEPVEPVEPPEA